MIIVHKQMRTNLGAVHIAIGKNQRWVVLVHGLLGNVAHQLTMNVLRKRQWLCKLPDNLL
jgi:hypothetical protein